MKYFDISPVISSRIGVFPGDQNFCRQESMSFKSGNHIQLSSIHTTLHVGAHADSSSHYHASGVGIEQAPLAPYFGKCQVIEIATRLGMRVGVEDIKHKLIESRRVLLKTNSFPDADRWNSDFMAIEPELIQFLAKKNVSLLGIDTPSVDPESAKNLIAHQAIFTARMSILEGLRLTHVPEGLYTLVALPLAIEAADASPVRAILIADDTLFSDQDPLSLS